MADDRCPRWVEELTRVTFRKTYPWLLMSAASLQRPKRLRKGALSLCMIVKNEADNLEKCLSLARPHVEEIVIVDTGSTDGTQEIAQRYADVYDEIEWPNSFSIARNYSFDHASCEFILILDGDEHIPDPLHWRRIRKCLRQRNLAAAQLPVRNLLREDQIVAADRMWQERIVRNHPQIRYFGRVHNQIQDSIAKHIQHTGRVLKRVQAEVIHTGYALSAERMKEKYQPRLHLLLAEYEQPRSAKLRAYYGYQLGVAYYILKELENAAKVFDTIDYSQLIPQNAFYTRVLAAQTAIALRNTPVALVHCNEMLTLDQSEPIAYYTTGLALLLNGQIGDGMLMLLEAFNLNDQDRTSIRFLMNPLQLLNILARVCTRSGLQKHGTAFQKLYEKRDFNPKLVRELVSSLKTGIVLSEANAA